MKLRWLLFGLLVLLAALRFGPLSGPARVRAQALQVPCRDPKGCPDLVVSARNLGQWQVVRRTFAPTDCAVVEGCVPQAGERVLLRFTSVTPNLGPGDLIIGDPTAPENRPFFRASECHGHLHFEEYADYRLWTPAGYAAWQQLRAQQPDDLPGDLLRAHPEIAAQMIAGRKQGFCVEDVVPAAPSVGPRKYTSCSRNQGLSVGWADAYPLFLDCQWIDITGIPPGRYVLEDEINAERLFQETNYRNNASATEVVVPDRPGRATSSIPENAKQLAAVDRGCCAGQEK